MRGVGLEPTVFLCGRFTVSCPRHWTIHAYNTRIIVGRVYYESLDFSPALVTTCFNAFCLRSADLLAVHEGIEPSSPDRQSGIIAVIPMNRIYATYLLTL